MANVTVMGDTEMGAGNVVFPGAVLGAPPQDLKFRGERTQLRIGDRNHFREHVTVHPGTGSGGGVTVIGSDNLLMVGSHVAHDCRVGDHAILANHVLLAGHVTVRDRAILNGASACHHFTTVGRMAYVGGLTRITQDVHPFTIVEGHPARVRACNSIGMERAGVAPEDVALVRSAVYAILVSDKTPAAEAMATLEREHPGHALLSELVGSIRAAAAGRQGRAAEPSRASP
jgi:UDP-N-acetylglucosamine acyltransferase